MGQADVVAGGGEGEDDPFEDLTLDDEFVKGAAVREPSARARANTVRHARLAREAERERAAAAKRSGRARRRRVGVSLLACCALLAAVLVVDHVESRPGGPPPWLADGASGAAYLGTRPTPRAASTDTPLGHPRKAPKGGGPHRWEVVQPGSGVPVAYDPCRPISVVVNDRTMPARAAGMVEAAIDRVSQVTGLRIELTGTTSERPVEHRAPYQPDRYGDRWAPVLVAWSDPKEVPRLSGDVAGIGGSAPASEDGGSRLVYVSGIVALDGPDLRAILRRDDGERAVMNVILHELGHLVGLAHVDDDHQLMYPRGQQGIDGYQDGDLAGLVRLGRGPCVPML